MNLQSLTLNDFVKLLINEMQAVEEFYKLQHNIRAGNTISLLFNPHRLITTSISSPESIYSSLQKENLLSGLARLYLYNLEHSVNNPFYMAVQRGYNGVQYINEFPPFVARSIYKEYCTDIRNQDSYRILDPCSGWGGRMIGCASLPNTHYVGFEPSTKTYEGLIKLGNWLKTLNASFSFEVHCMPFEDAKLDTDSFDVALTSPPYFNTERYSDEPTNSCNRYNAFDSWVENFYTPLILNTMHYIKPDAKFVLNVGDRKYPLSQTLFNICKNNGLYCTQIRDYLSGHGEGKEKFYCVSHKPFAHKDTQHTLF